MCGLIFDFRPGNPNPGERQKAAHNALRALAHRGPDDSRLLYRGGALLGHVRLSIIDLEDSRQPMETPDGRFVLAYNGEIYNYRELRAELSDRWEFRTSGDTEVLLAGLVLEGVPFLSRLNGMWAFALWDTKQMELLLCRDRMGKKPLYYLEQERGIACASELPALRILSVQGFCQDPDSTADYFRYGYFLPGYTAWKGVLEVLPGHWMRWSADGRSTGSYWQLPLPDASFTVKDLELRDTMEVAVQDRLVADVEVGAFLSGGVDSSLICTFAQKHLQHPLRTYTVGFDNPDYDERSYADRMARHLGTKHRAEVLQPLQAEDLEHLLKTHFGQPFADSSVLPTLLVSRLAATEVKVVLSGDGGDELFGGYQRYQARMLMRWYSRLPTGLRRLAERAVLHLPEPTAHHSRSLLKKLHLFVAAARRQQAETPYTAPLLFHPDDYAKLFPELVGRGHTPPEMPEETTLDDLQRMLFADALVYLPQDILQKVDRATMAHGLEARAPFLDHRVVELAFSLPAGRHLRIGQGKKSVAAAFSDLLPSWIWKRRKQGFAVPVNEWFRGRLAERLLERLESSSSVVASDAVRGLLQEHRYSNRDHGYRLWTIYTYLLFQR